jgi:hypothetical protein
LMPSIESCGLGSGKIIAAAKEREREEREEKERARRSGGEK